MRCALLLVVLFIVAGCANRPAQDAAAVDLTNIPVAEWRDHVGRRISARGTLSQRGRLGPLVLVRGHPVYLLSQNPHASGRRFETMEGRHVRAAGVLRFARASAEAQIGLPSGQPSDHYYLDAESARVEVIQP